MDIQRAIQDDQKVYDEDGEGTYGDNKPDIVEAQDPFEAELAEDDSEVEDVDIEDM